ncbi:MAG: hypothetical protein GOV02_01700, partial [Candidatus Aenigmarchaeota archaeon]|nr:hypothetical protein [Candidatus Aenigmarchaeota archaeon]
MEAKRLTAKKTSNTEISKGKFVKKLGFESSYVLTDLGRRLSRVRVLGLIVDKFISQDEKYATLTLDDGKDTLRLKSFVNVKIFNGLEPGALVDVFGKVKEYNGEIYVTPEILKKVDANFETLRALELKEIKIDQLKKIKLVEDQKNNTSDINELEKALKNIVSREDIESIIEADEILITDTEEVAEKSVHNKEKILELIGK